MKPDATLSNFDPAYLRLLIDKAKLRKVISSQRDAARRLGIDERTMRYALDSNPKKKPTYLIQFGLECLADYREVPEGYEE